MQKLKQQVFEANMDLPRYGLESEPVIINSRTCPHLVCRETDKLPGIFSQMV
ncbi:hypothetical protein ACVWDN_25580 [Escherichia coli]